jgi:hypothetical protein
MRLSTPLLFLLHLTLTTSFSLNEFQPIVSFPAACTAAYNTPMTSCSASDFENGNPCSKSCIANLQSISVKINTFCQGTRADPTTLIGLIFQGEGVSTICPNVVAVSVGSDTADGNNIGSSTLVASSKSQIDKSIAAATSSSEESSTTTVSSRKASKTSAAASSTTKTSIPTPEKTTASRTTSASSPPPSSSMTATLRGGFTSTAVNNGVVTVITDKAQQTANADGFGGGGSPFEVGVNGGATLSAHVLVTVLATFMVGMGVMVR